MRTMRTRGFFELTWSIFRFCMKSIFAVLSVFYLFAALVLCALSPDVGAMAPHHFVASLGGALLFGLVFVSYVTLLLAVPVSAFCALAAFMVTGVIRAYDVAFPNPRGIVLWGDLDAAIEPGAVDIVDARVSAQDALCPVCAVKLDAERELVNCVRCEAPHHPECWAYIGSCATFGCGSDRSSGDPERTGNRQPATGNRQPASSCKGAC
jgi:hypothetical protein